MLKNFLYFSTLFLFAVGAAADTIDRNAGKGWVQQSPYSPSVHQALVRELVALDPWDRKLLGE